MHPSFRSASASDRGPGTVRLRSAGIEQFRIILPGDRSGGRSRRTATPIWSDWVLAHDRAMQRSWAGVRPGWLALANLLIWGYVLLVMARALRP